MSEWSDLIGSHNEKKKSKFLSERKKSARGFLGGTINLLYPATLRFVYESMKKALYTAQIRSNVTIVFYQFSICFNTFI